MLAGVFQWRVQHIETFFEPSRLSIRPTCFWTRLYRGFLSYFVLQSYFVVKFFLLFLTIFGFYILNKTFQENWIQMQTNRCFFGNLHGKKGGVYLVENARWIYAKRGICLHLLVFTDRKIQGFPIVLLSVNSSIRSIIPYFPITVNAGKRMFSGICRSVNTWRMSCLPVFTHVFRV